MMNSYWAKLIEGQIKLLEPIEVHEGARLLISVVLESDDSSNWQAAQMSSMKAVWDNPDDDIYAQLH